jgi:hypothetical protein
LNALDAGLERASRLGAPFSLLVVDSVLPWFWQLQCDARRPMYLRDVGSLLRQLADKHRLVVIATKQQLV